MSYEIRKCLLDIITSIESIDDYLGKKRNFIEYQKNKLLRRAIEREIEIIGEATNRILKTDADFKIENVRKIIATRNKVIHGYDAIDNAIIWGIVINHLPKLKIEVKNLLTEQQK